MLEHPIQFDGASFCLKITPVDRIGQPNEMNGFTVFISFAIYKNVEFLMLELFLEKSEILDCSISRAVILKGQVVPWNRNLTELC